VLTSAACMEAETFCPMSRFVYVGAHNVTKIPEMARLDVADFVLHPLYNNRDPCYRTLFRLKAFLLNLKMNNFGQISTHIQQI
jgi:hypothetical protein